MRVPQNNWTQTNAGELFGFLNKTHNVHFDEAGSVTLSGKPVSYYSENEVAEFKYVLAITYLNHRSFFDK